jgi:hypothetical protein
MVAAGVSREMIIRVDGGKFLHHGIKDALVLVVV